MWQLFNSRRWDASCRAKTATRISGEWGEHYRCTKGKRWRKLVADVNVGRLKAPDAEEAHNVGCGRSRARKNQRKLRWCTWIINSLQKKKRGVERKESAAARQEKENASRWKRRQALVSCVYIRQDRNNDVFWWRLFTLSRGLSFRNSLLNSTPRFTDIQWSKLALGHESLGFSFSISTKFWVSVFQFDASF